jgi:hypothetical protein
MFSAVRPSQSESAKAIPWARSSPRGRPRGATDGGRDRWAPHHHGHVRLVHVAPRPCRRPAVLHLAQQEQQVAQPARQSHEGSRSPLTNASPERR